MMNVVKWFWVWGCFGIIVESLCLLEMFLDELDSIASLLLRIVL